MKTTASITLGLLCAMNVGLWGQEASEMEVPTSEMEPSTEPKLESTEEEHAFQKLDISTTLSSSQTLSERVVVTIESPLSYTNRLDRMENARTVFEGGLVPVVKKPSFGSFFQLFNPMAPREYGGMESSWGAPGFSRAFHDPVSSEPTSPLFSIGFKPESIRPQADVSDSAQ